MHYQYTAIHNHAIVVTILFRVLILLIDIY